MIRSITLALVVVLLFSSCNLSAREEALRKKEAALNDKEQQLALREKLLEIKEQEVAQLKEQLDSVKTKMDSVKLTTDTAQAYNQQLTGDWNVKMTCTATTCPGSAVGDIKTETWSINYEDNLIVARAMVNDKLVRVYTGNYDGNMLSLTENVTDLPAEPATTMNIRLNLTDSNTMDGQREIIRENDCRIVYNLQLKKQQSSSK